MTNSAEVQLIINAINNASRTIKEVEGDVSKMNKSTAAAKDFIAGMGVSLADFSNPAMMAGRAVGFVTDQTKIAINETLTYNKSIRDLAQNLGRSTEETSRIIQTMDDFGVSQANVTTALEMALKNGFAPSIDTLAKMADEYNKIQDPTERATKLTEVFGKNWTELVPALKMGGQAIRDAAAEQNDALLVTEEAAQAARDYEVAIDGVNDTISAFKYSIGNQLIPPLTAFIDKQLTAQNGAEKLAQGIKSGVLSQKEALAITNKIGREYIDWAAVIKTVDDRLKDVTQTEDAHDRATQVLTGSVEKMTAAEIANNLVMVSVGDQSKSLSQLYSNLSYDYSLVTNAVEKSTKATDDFFIKLDALKSLDYSTVDLGLDSMIKKNLDEMKIEAAGGGGWDDIVATALKLKDEGKITGEVASDILTMAAIAFEKAKMDAGLENIWEGSSNLAETLRISKEKARELLTKPIQSEVDAINKMTASIKVSYEVVGSLEQGNYAGATVGSNSNRRAAGGPVAAGAAYIVGENGPEMFVPRQAGTIVPNQITNNWGGININGSNASPQDIARAVGREFDRRR